MNPNIILIPPCNSYGDIMSIVSMIHFLLNYYDTAYLYLYRVQYAITHFYKEFFIKNDNILFVFNDEAENILNLHPFDSFHICNTHTGNWKHHENNYTLYNNLNINREHYFCDTNPLYNFLDIPEVELCKPNLTLPLQDFETNSIIYYKMVGLNNNVRMNYFQYKRNYEKEISINNEIRDKFNLIENEKYNIICTSSNNEFISIDRIKTKINNNYKCIDINMLVEFPGWLFKFIENAEELHLVEGCNVNFIYYSQYKNIIDLNSKQIYLHIWARNRLWDEFKLDYGWKMMCYPQLNNWILLFDE